MQKNIVGYWIKIVIMMALFFSGWIFPEGEIITALGMKVIGIFMGMMFGWIFLDLIYPSFIGMLVLVFAGFGGGTKALFASGFGAELIVLIILFGTFSAYMNHVGLSDTIAKWILTRKALQGRPWLFIFSIFVLIYLLGIMIDIYPAIFLMWPVCYKICDDLGYEKRSVFTSYLCFAVTFVAGLGMLAKPFSVWCLPGLDALEQATGLTVNYTMFTVFMTISSAITMILFVLAGKYCLGLDVSNFKNNNYDIGELNYTHDQKIATAYIIALFVIMYAPSILPESWKIAQILNQLGVIGRQTIMIIALGMAVRKTGEPLTNIANLASQGVPFNMVFLLAGTQVLGAAMKSPDCGITEWIGVAFSPLLSGLSPLMFYIALAILYGITTQVVHNLVLLTMFTPIAIEMGALVGANPILVTFVGLIMLNAALVTPGASSRSGLVFSNTTYIDPKKAYLLGLIAVLVAFIACVVTLPIAEFMF